MHTLKYSAEELIAINLYSKKDMRKKRIYTFFLIALAGFPFFTTGITFTIIPFIILFFISYSKRIKIEKESLMVFFILTLILMGQILVFNYIAFETIIGTYISFINAYLLVKLIGKDLDIYVVDVICFFTVISFIFYLPSMIFPSFEIFLKDNVASLFNRDAGRRGYNYVPNFIIYSLNTGITLGSDYEDAYIKFGRNPGPFHEAGGFGIFLVISLIFNTIRTHKILNKRNMLLLLGIISTFSTTTFITTALFLTLYISTSRKIGLNVFILPSIIFLSYYSYNHFDFLGKKISIQLEAAISNDPRKAESRERLANFVVDMQDAFSYPLTGRGKNEHTRFENFKEFGSTTHKNNGISDLAATYGIFFFIYYFTLMFNTVKMFSNKYGFYNNKFALALLLIIIIIGFSQVIFGSIFFLGLLFYSKINKTAKVVNYKLRES